MPRDWLARFGGSEKVRTVSHSSNYPYFYRCVYSYVSWFILGDREVAKRIVR